MENIKKALENLISNYGMLALRADFASEIISDEELDAFKKLSKEYQLGLTVKIGGCDALNEINNTKKIEADSIIIPMSETPYAIKKFIENCRKIYSEKELDAINLYPNIETITTYNNFDEILHMPEMNYINGFVLGRDDMSASIGLEKNEINSDRMFEISKNIAQKTTDFNKKFIIGGEIRPQATEFLTNIRDYLAHFETRMVVFSKETLYSDKLFDAIYKATGFEIMWIKYFKPHNIKRIEKLEQSLSKIELLK